MSDIKKNSILLIVLCILMAQGTNTLHFFLYHLHPDEVAKNYEGYIITESEPHQCDFILFNSKSTFLFFEKHNLSLVDFKDEKINRFLKNKEIQSHKKTNFNRGPPLNPNTL